MSVVLCNSRRPVGVRYAPFATEDALRGNMSRRARFGLMQRSKQALFDHRVGAGARGSFGQPRFPKPLNQQLRLRKCLSRPGDPHRYCKGGIELEQTRRRLTCLSVTSEMGRSGCETAVSLLEEGVLTKGFPRCNNRLVKATELN
jgi:hypothetical protein